MGLQSGTTARVFHHFHLSGVCLGSLYICIIIILHIVLHVCAIPSFL